MSSCPSRVGRQQTLSGNPTSHEQEIPRERAQIPCKFCFLARLLVVVCPVRAETARNSWSRLRQHRL
ncbi:hypothetical protein ABBQ32_008838 [Trebouxia sp. C0010 RCD-2024]